MKNPDLSHGAATHDPLPFTELFPSTGTAVAHRISYPPADLLVLSQAMADQPDSVKDGADPEENAAVPAGYTYFGQFIDHDLTFDSTSSLDPSLAVGEHSRQPTNLRTPRLDLDCLYGDGPDAQPYMYDTDGASLLFQHSSPNPALAQVDLLRNPNGRAIIGDKRNDENSIVSQIQLGMVQYHNEVVKHLKGQNSGDWTVPDDLFKSARNEVRWAYQRLVLHDYLPRIIAPEVLTDLAASTPTTRNYVLYKSTMRANLPREFVAAAYRFGHSMVRAGYRLNAGIDNRFHIFGSSKPQANELKETPPSLLGFDPLPANHVIDNWHRFFPTTAYTSTFTALGKKANGDAPHATVRLQFAYKIDPTIVDPLSVLPRQQVAGGAAKEAETALGGPLPDPTGRPSLGLLNLIRGNTYNLVSGQTVARKLFADATLKQAIIASRRASHVPLDGSRLVTRHKEDVSDTTVMSFKTIDPSFEKDTPLWFYVLAEAQAPLVDALSGSQPFNEDKLLDPATNHTQLGWVGGRILAEVFYGILDSDHESVIHAVQNQIDDPQKKKNLVVYAPAGWKPLLGGNGDPLFNNLLNFKA